MGWLKLFKPKIAIALILFILSYAVQSTYENMTSSDYWRYGSPLPFSEHWAPCPGPPEACQSFSIVFFALDLVAWYVVAALMVFFIKPKKNAKG